ncbi:MAG: hypothetical protein ACI4NR_02590 [Megasphaera sp.]|uniref:hypothetical protein n=1 Tax=Megasphaera sp. TaxID=2023260 RepID=UPI003F0395C4
MAHRPDTCPEQGFIDVDIAQAGHFMGELEFGIHHTERTGMYYGSQDLYDLWNSDQPALVVVTPKYRDEALSVLGSAPAQRINEEDYTVFLNAAAAHDNQGVTSR